MFGVAGRRAAEILVGLFALLGFVCVPIGQKTGLEHLIAIGRAPAVAQAALELWSVAQRTGERVRRALQDEARVPPPRASSSPQPELPDFGPPR